MAVDHYQKLTNSLYQAVLNGNIEVTRRYMDAGANPAENFTSKSTPRLSRCILLSRGGGLFVQEGRQDDVAFSVFHAAVLFCYSEPQAPPPYLQIVEEILARHPNVIAATVQGMLAVSHDENFVKIEDGLGSLQFFSRLATIEQRPVPHDLIGVLVTAAGEYELTTSRGFPRKLMKKLHDEDDDVDSLADIAIRCADGNTIIPAHKTILMAASPYFRTVLGGQWRDTHDGVWDARVSSVVMRAIKRYIYKGEFSTDQFPLQKDFLQELLVASHQYKLLDLFGLCEMQLIRLLSVKNFADLLILAGEREEDAGKLYNACVYFFGEYPKELAFDESFQRVRDSHPHVWRRLKESISESETRILTFGGV